MLPLLLAFSLALAQPGSTTPEPPPTSFDDAWLLGLKARSEARDAALAAISTGDPLASLLAVADALALDPADKNLLTARDRLLSGALLAATARAETLRAAGDPHEALDLLSRLAAVAPSGGAGSHALTEAIRAARVDAHLADAARFEAEGQPAAARRSLLLAGNLAPDDERLRNALAFSADPPRPVDPAPPPSTSPNTNATDIANERLDRQALEREVDLLRRNFDALSVMVQRIEREITLPAGGGAEPAVRELRHSIDDLRRDFDRFMSDVRREVSALSRDVDSLRRDIARPR